MRSCHAGQLKQLSCHVASGWKRVCDECLAEHSDSDLSVPPSRWRLLPELETEAGKQRQLFSKLIIHSGEGTDCVIEGVRVYQLSPPIDGFCMALVFANDDAAAACDDK